MDEEDEARAEPGTGTGGGPQDSARIAPNKFRRLQAAEPGSGRKLFDAARKAVFLEWFTGTANLSWAARMAGVHYRTVLRHRAEDAVFAEAYDLAEAQAVPRLRAWLAEAKAGEAERLKGAALGTVTGDCPLADDVGGEIAPARLTVEQAMQFLRDHEQSLARRAKAGAAQMGPGAGRGRPFGIASNAEVREALIKALRAHGIRVRSFETASRLRSTPPQDERSPVEARDPLHHASHGPPPRSGEDC